MDVTEADVTAAVGCVLDWAINTSVSTVTADLGEGARGRNTQA